MKLQLLALPLLVALMLSPMFAAAATGTLTFTSPTAGTQLTGTASYTISGTISPVPAPGTDNVNIQVTNPASVVVDVQTVAVSSTGTFTYSTNAGGNSAWTTGAYKILATDSNGATNTETFQYTASSTQASGAAPLVVNARSANIVYAGQAVQIFASAYWTANGTAVKTVTWTASVWGPTGSSSGVTWTASSPTQGVELWTGTLPTSASDGVYGVWVSASASGVTAAALTSFQVNSQVASSTLISSLASSITKLSSNLTSVSSSVSGISSSLTALTSSVNGLSNSVGSINSQLGTLSTSVQGLGTSLTQVGNNVNTISSSITGITSSITTLTNDVTGLQSDVSGLGNLPTAVSSLQTSVNNLNSSVSNAQTYILVVAALAVITLVLELAILIRKMS